MLIEFFLVGEAVEVKSDGGIFTIADHGYLVSVTSHIQKVYYSCDEFLALVQVILPYTVTFIKYKHNISSTS